MGKGELRSGSATELYYDNRSLPCPKDISFPELATMTFVHIICKHRVASNITTDGCTNLKTETEEGPTGLSDVARIRQMCSVDQ